MGLKQILEQASVSARRDSLQVHDTEVLSTFQEVQETMSAHLSTSSCNAISPVHEGETVDTASSARNMVEPSVTVQHVCVDARPTPPVQVVPIAPNTAYSGRALTQRS